MEELTHDAKIAILRILSDIANADNIIHPNEVSYLDEVARSLDLDENFRDEVNNMVTLQALSIIRVLPPEIKGEITRLMGKMIVADEDINYNEVKLYNTVCETCNMRNNFNVEDYPEYTLSYPFVNPEDLI